MCCFQGYDFTYHRIWIQLNKKNVIAIIEKLQLTLVSERERVGLAFITQIKAK